MKKFYLLVFVSLFTSQLALLAQGSREYRVTVEVVELCGYGGSDGNGKEEYRWNVYSRFKGDGGYGFFDLFPPRGETIGADNVPPGTCITGPTANTTGPNLPYKLYENTATYSPGEVIELELPFVGWEYDPNDDDDDVVFDVLDLPIVIDESIGVNTKDYPASQLGTKYSMKVRYTVTPPVKREPKFAYTDDFEEAKKDSSAYQTMCSGEQFYMTWLPIEFPKPLKIQKVIFYENVNNEQYFEGYEHTYDQGCVQDVDRDCIECQADFNTDENSPECEARCDRAQCITSSEPIWGDFIWNEVASVDTLNDKDVYAVKLTAPTVASGEVKKRFAIKVVTTTGATSIDYSLTSKYVTFFPQPPTLNGFPSNTTDKVLDPGEAPLVSNQYMEIQHVVCRGDETGSISIKKIDDSRKFYYTLDPLEDGLPGYNIANHDPPSTSNPVAFDDLPSGRYVLKVSIENPAGTRLCFSSQEIAIKEPAALPSATYETKKYIGGAEVSCHDAEDGEIILTPSGGIPPYTYILKGTNIDDKIQEGDSIFSNLAPLDDSGNPVTYTFEITDKYNCEFKSTASIVLSVPAPVEFAAVEPVNRYSNPDDASEYYDIRCHGGTDSLEFFLTGGAGPYQLYIGDELKASTQGESQQAIIGGLKADTTYAVTMFDANGCDTTTYVSLTQPDEVILAEYHVIPAACYGSATASLGLKAGKGIPYSGHAYLYTIRHLDVPAELDFPFDEEQSITTPVDSAVFLDLIAGPYEVIMEDFFGCVSVDTVLITEPDRLNTSVTNTYIQCKGDNNGAATTFIEGGTAPFTVTWTDEFKTPFYTETINSGESTSVNGLAGGLYYVFVEDANGCKYPRSGTPFTIQEPALELDIFYGNIENATCYGEADGSVTLQASGGWRNVPYKFGTDKTNLTYNNNVYSQLTPGAYKFFVQDGKGCMDSVELVIEEPEALQVQLAVQTTVSCSGGSDGSFEVTATGGVPPYQYSLDNGATWSESGQFNGLNSGDYQVTVEDANSTCPLIKHVHIEEPSPLYITLTDNTGTACGSAAGSAAVEVNGGTLPYSYEWKNMAGTTIGTSPNITNLEAGQYQFIVTDKNGCENSRQVTISNPEGPQVQVSAVTPVSCAGGNDGIAVVEVTASSSNVSITWPDGQNGAQASGLSAGNYIVEFRDEAGCLTFLELNVPEPEPLKIAYSTISPSCHSDCDGAITLDVTGGNGNYTYAWANGITGITSSDLCSGNYQVEVTDAKGCSTTATITIEDPEPISPDLGDDLTVCEGQQHQLDAGYPGGTYSWTSDIGFTANTRKVTIDQAGTYNLEVTDINGCKGTESFKLDISNDLLEAEFLVLTEAIAGDTVVLVNISYPEPGASRWEFPEEVIALDAYGYHQQLIFPKEGTYLVTLYTELASCQAEMTKQILVTSPTGEASKDVFGYTGEMVEEFAIYPNPSDGKFTASVVLKEQKNIRLKLVDIQGQRELGDFTGEGQASYEVNYEFNDLLKGVYFLLLEVDGKAQTMKVLIK